ncbi:HAD family hydrolase [Lentzea nigeriaca]|uniref:HAD family hydrolase n=1 Tax=Lentzea nigeriaca TaxID=1128665 RepID=UPI0027DE477E|nr:HAD-IA family hydrolase [Lentzea nigeriaca]MBM7857740.1 HAD superfamily hydrolase (TIGR01549 family) [Lentzea nigeriaca]
MTKGQISVDDSTTLLSMLASAEALFLDFDGPICSVFAGFPAPLVAEQLRNLLAVAGDKGLPPKVQKSNDPFEVFGFVANSGYDHARYAEAALRAHEVEAIATAEPTAGANRLIRTWHASGRKVAIVSNNSAAAVEAYLHRYSLMPYVHCISARTEADPRLLKPNPFLLRQASDRLDTAATKSVMIGDSLSDIQAAQAADVPVIGYANKPGKLNAFKLARPDAIIKSIALIAGLASLV